MGTMDLLYESILVVAVALVAVGILLYLYFVVWALKRKPVTGVESMKGKSGVVVNDFANNMGEVFVDGVIWKAKSDDFLVKDDSVVVVGVSALGLFVKKKKS